MQYPKGEEETRRKRDEKGVVDFGLSRLGGGGGFFCFKGLCFYIQNAISILERAPRRYGDAKRVKSQDDDASFSNSFLFFSARS